MDFEVMWPISGRLHWAAADPLEERLLRMSKNENQTPQITQKEIDQLKNYRGKVQDILDGKERWLPDDHPDKTPEELAALREFEEEELRGDQAFSIFLTQCANLISIIQMRIIARSPLRAVATDDVADTSEERRR